MWNTTQLALLPLLQAAPTTAPDYGGMQGPDLSRYVTICVVLILAIGGVAWGFKRLVAGNLKARANKRSLQILDVLPLGGKQRLAVVRCYDRTFALGLGDKEVSAIAELDPVIGEEREHEREPAADGPQVDDQTFQRALAHVQRALAKTREGTGPAKALRAQAANTNAQAVEAAPEPSRTRAASEPANDARARVAELVDAAAQRSAPRRERAKAAPEAPQAAQPKRRKRAATKSAKPAKRKPATAERSTTERARVARPAPEAASVPTLGLEGVMG